MADKKEDKKDGKEAKEAKEAEGEAATAAPKKSKTMLFVVIGLVVLLLICAGVAGVFIVKANNKKAETESLEGDSATSLEEQNVAEGSGEEDERDETEDGMGAIFPMESYVVNLQGGKFIRAQIQVEFAEKDIPQRFFAKNVVIRDGIISLLTSKSADDVLGADGKRATKEQIKELINNILKKEEVREIYFTQFVVQ